MSVMMNPVLPVPGPEVMTKRVERSSNTDNSFAGYLDRKLDEKYDDGRDMLGVGQRDETSRQDKLGVSGAADFNEPAEQPQEAVGELVGGPEVEQEDTTLVGFLGQFMQELQEVAEQQTGLPGEWNVALPELEVFKQMAVNAGMSEVEIAQFMQQIDSTDQKVSLVDLFSALNQFFEEMDTNPPVTVPETEFPMLEALMVKMGVPQDSLTQLASQAVTGEGKLDLSKLLQGLQSLDGVDVEGLSSIVLTDVEAEQLQNILSQAGVTLEEQNELLPERFLNQVLGQTDEDGQSVQLTLERLQSILKQGVTNAQANEPKLDLPAFMKDLQKIVAQSGFESQSPGWTPVVQQTVNAIFQQIQELVDLAKVQVEENKFMEEEFDNADYSKWLNDLQEKFSGNMGGQDDPADFAEGNFQGQPKEETTQIQQGPAIQTQGASPLSGLTAPTVVESTPDVMPATDASRAASAQRLSANQLQQQVVQQISSGVMHGLRNQEHHLILRLYPQDLGEVKVNITVKDEQVSVSFNMENSKVKEMLESNMQEFKDSMNQKGFTLGECSVSTGEKEDSGELWQRFEMARKTIEAARGTLADLPEDTLYHQVNLANLNDHDNAISLVV